MKLLVFSTKYADHIITLFDKLKFTHFVDAVHIADIEYLKKNFGPVPHLFVYLRGDFLEGLGLGDAFEKLELSFAKVNDYENPRTPDFIIYFDEFEEIDPSDWFFLETYFERIFAGLELPMLTRRREFLLQTSVQAEEISWGILEFLKYRELEC
jgi:hypothetical protein